MPLHVSPAEFARLEKASIAQPKRTRASPGTAPGSWPQGAICTVCNQPIRRLQSFSCDAQEHFAHLACLAGAGRPLSELQAAIEQWQEERSRYVKQ